MSRPESDFEKMKKSRKMKSLENCCVICIADNVGSFINEYRFGNSIPKKHFEFIQRMYSKSLLQSSSVENLVKYVDFFLNPYFKEIDLTKFRFYEQGDIKVIIRQLKRIGETVKLLSIQNQWGDATGKEKSLLELTSSLPNVESLSPGFIRTPKLVLENISSNCPALRVLDVSHNRYVDDAALKTLWMKGEGMTSTLVSLDITDTAVTTNGLILALKNFPNLEILRNNYIDEAMCKFHLDDFMTNSLTYVKYNLKELRFFCRYNEISCNALKMIALICPRVLKLEVYGITSQAEIEACTKFNELKNIWFFGSGCSSITPTMTPFIQHNGKDLINLKVTRLTISIEAILKCCPRLQTLELQKITFELFKDVASRKISYALPYLKQLTFSLSILDEIYAKSIDLILSSAPKLEEISFFGSTNLTHDFIKAMTEHDCMSTILKVNVSSSDIRFSTAREILDSTPNLTDFRLDNCLNITKAEYKQLLTIRRDVDMVWSNVNDTDVNITWREDSDLDTT